MTSHGWSAARDAAYRSARPLPAKEIPAADALGTTLADALVAAAPMPSFDTAAMDGYAVAGDPPWRLVGMVAAGPVERCAIAPGEAVEIATGAWVPTGATAVLPYEHADCKDNLVTGDVPAGRHIRRVGEEMAAGATVAPAGTPVTPALLGLAAGLAVDALSVRGPARVLALVIGNEVGLTGLPGSGRIRDSIGPMLPGLIPALGGRLTGIVRLGDRQAEVTEAVRTADADVVLSCGASSVGRADTVRASLRALGARLVVDGVSCRPGHPQALAELADGRWLVALPGNPYAALVAAMTLLDPLLTGLAGRALPELPTATFTGDVRSRTERTRLVPVTGRAGAVRPIGTDRPASLHGAALAEALAVIPPGWAGEPVQLVALPH